MFKQTARLWAHVYAGAPVSSPEYTKKIENLCAMGFDRVSNKKGILILICGDFKSLQHSLSCQKWFKNTLKFVDKLLITKISDFFFSFSDSSHWF